MPALIEETVELIAPRAQAKSLEIACYVEDGLPQSVTGDAARLRQVLLNLAGNAVKFTERGGVAVIVEPGRGPDEIRFLVRDTGIGIAPDEQDRIFLEFEQADSSASRKFGGTGLGLAISKRIIERMGGRIGVDSTPGAGSTFHFAVPLRALGAGTRRPSSRPILPAPTCCWLHRRRSRLRSRPGASCGGAGEPASFPMRRLPPRCCRSGHGAQSWSTMRWAPPNASGWRAQQRGLRDASC